MTPKCGRWVPDKRAEPLAELEDREGEDSRWSVEFSSGFTEIQLLGGPLCPAGNQKGMCGTQKSKEKKPKN